MNRLLPRSPAYAGSLLLGLILIFAAACGGSGFTTGEASLTTVTPSPKSASAKPFVLTVGTTMTMGWTVNFIDGGAGTDCMDEKNNIVASIGIYTNQVDDGKHIGAALTNGDIVIVQMSPPTVTGTAAATMGAMGASQIVGTVTITDFYKDHIYGTVNAGGKDSQGTAVSLTGMFKAPACGTP
jgi:hypothetical protein